MIQTQLEQLHGNSNKREEFLKKIERFSEYVVLEEMKQITKEKSLSQAEIIEIHSFFKRFSRDLLRFLTDIVANEEEISYETLQRNLSLLVRALQHNQ